MIYFFISFHPRSDRNSSFLRESKFSHKDRSSRSPRANDRRVEFARCDGLGTSRIGLTDDEERITNARRMPFPPAGIGFVLLPRDRTTRATPRPWRTLRVPLILISLSGAAAPEQAGASVCKFFFFFVSIANSRGKFVLLESSAIPATLVSYSYS